MKKTVKFICDAAVAACLFAVGASAFLGILFGPIVLFIEQFGRSPESVLGGLVVGGSILVGLGFAIDEMAKAAEPSP